MKRSLTLAVALAAGSLLAAGQATAARPHAALAPVTIVMHDPGCHWFSVNGKFTTHLTVKGPASLSNLDEATLDVIGPSGLRKAAVGRKITLPRGGYRIVMVGQARDDNVLTLLVR